jgi:hypothetical protein
MDRQARVSVILIAVMVVSLLLGACGGQPTEQPTVQVHPTTVPASPSPAATAAEPTSAATEAATPASPPADETTAPEPTPAELASTNAVFGTFQEPAVQVVPSVQQEAIAPDLSNVQSAFALSDAQRQQLAQNGFVVSSGTEKEFFTVYEKARYANVPIIVTSDSLLHVYHLLFDKVLRTAEVQYFIPLLQDLNAAVLLRAEEEYEALQGTAWEDAARRTVAFVGVGAKLVDANVQVPAYASDLVDAELALIQGAAGIQPSPIFPYLPLGEDYTQYIPRGHYTQSEELKAYFRSMMWYGRMTFRLKTEDPDVGRAETRSALLLVNALRTAEIAYRPALEVWGDLYNPTAFMVGSSDDLTALQYGEVMDAVYGPGAPVSNLADDSLLDSFIEKADELPPPKILGMVIYDTQDETQTTKGLRFMGQRFVPDAYIFRQLIYRNVGTADNRRGLPKGLDLLAAMGSQRAYQILDQEGDTAFPKYTEQMAKVQGWMSGLTTADWTQTLYNTWLYSFQPLLQVPGQGYPAFMQSAAWVDKQLNTVLGSWSELKHDTILYAKQVYAEAGAGPMPPEPVPPKDYVEPVPEFFARLAALTAMTREGLGSRNLLDPEDSDSLQRLQDLATSFQTMAEKELRGEALLPEEYGSIRNYGTELEHLTMAAADKSGEPGGQIYMEEEPQAAVVADVATDPDPGGNGSLQAAVLEEAVGRIDEIHVVVPVVADDGSTYLEVAKGGVFSYYEFQHPANDRLTDEKWRQMLDQGTNPPRPTWTGSYFTAEGESSDLTQAVYSFQTSLSGAVWFLEPGYLRASGEALAQITAELDALRAKKQYEGRQLISSRIRSVDRQTIDKAVVTVRETWTDSLYTYTDYPGGEPGDPVSVRGPYTLDVTYTLEQGEQGWLVTKAVYANEPPAW